MKLYTKEHLKHGWVVSVEKPWPLSPHLIFVTHSFILHWIAGVFVYGGSEW